MALTELLGRQRDDGNVTRSVADGEFLLRDYVIAASARRAAVPP
jgi:hypothetical protein